MTRAMRATRAAALFLTIPIFACGAADAVLRVQLKKLPQVIASMHRSKYRIRQTLEQYPEVRLRRIVDREGDTGCFLISTYKDPETARRICDALRAEGI